jgi:hypothetical protein
MYQHPKIAAITASLAPRVQVFAIEKVLTASTWIRPAIRLHPLLAHL